MVSILEDVQSSQPGTLIEMFDIDLAPLGNAVVLRFFPGSDETTEEGAILWQGNEYLPRPIAMEGLEVSGRGALPRPTLAMSNIFGEYNTIEQAYGRLEGAMVTRWKTFTRYLDAQPTADPNAYFPIDQFYLDRVKGRNDVRVILELRTVIDVGDKMLPARQVLRSTCTHIYRTWDGAEFDYSNVTCPYTGEDYFTEANGPTPNPAGDKCSKNLTGCRLRFGSLPLPTRAFPSAGRYR